MSTVSMHEPIAVSARGAARLAGCGIRTVLGAIETGALPASRIGTKRYSILTDDVLGWIRSRRVEPAGQGAAERQRAAQ